MNAACNFCNNTDDVCCDEENHADEKTPRHIIDPQDEHNNNRADSHVFMLNGLLAAKDVAMPRAGV